MNNIFIIAEAGVNHNGSVGTAKDMIDVAKEAGCDAVKFQSFITEKCICRYASKANYQKHVMGDIETQYDMVKKLELNANDHRILSKYCQKREIMFLSTPFDLTSVELLAGLGVPIFKIASGEITNMPLLDKIGSLKKYVLLSTGMADLEEVRSALKVLNNAGTDNDHITVLQCNTEYPTPCADANLRAMLTMRDTLKVNVGYSDHTLGFEVLIAAVAMGATVVEKHFTLDKNMTGPDHRISLIPEELKLMVKAVRNVEMALGNGIKQPSPSERLNRDIVRKSIVAAKNIRKGESFSEDNITVKRSGGGISPMAWDTVMGKKAVRDIKEDERIIL